MSSEETPSAPGPKLRERFECPRWRCEKVDMGTGRLHEGKRWGLLGDLGELLVCKETLDVDAVPRCGSVEFFVDGVGEHLCPQ